VAAWLRRQRHAVPDTYCESIEPASLPPLSWTHAAAVMEAPKHRLVIKWHASLTLFLPCCSRLELSLPCYSTA
jgi:hypothetical protein